MSFKITLKKELNESVVSIGNEVSPTGTRDLVRILDFLSAVRKIEINTLRISGDQCARHHLS